MLVSVAGPGALYRRVYESIRQAILDGRLRPGSRLPATRTLARELGVSRTTVLLAYDQLLSEGYVTGRVGSGTFVAPELPDAGPARTGASPAGEAARPRLSRFGERVAAADVVTRPREHALRFDFRYGLPPVEEFPHETWRRLLGRRARGATLRQLQYGPPEGFGPLREAVADYLRRSRAVRCDAEQVMIVNGSQQALDLTARVLLDPGDAVVLEEPCYQGARKVFLAAGAALTGAPVDAEGLDAAGALPPAKLAYVTPSHQFPTGSVMSLPRRLALLAWAEREGAHVIEDDYDSEFRYEGKPVESVQGLDRAGRVIYAGTFSKVLYPALRVGYVVLPGPLVRPFAAAKWLADRHTPTLEQAALADFIAEGHFERHLRRSRARNAARRAALLEALRDRLGARVEVAGANAGIHLLVWLRDLPPGGVDGLIARAEREGVGIYSVGPSYATAPPRAGLLMGYASMTEAQIREGVAKLARLL